MEEDENIKKTENELEYEEFTQNPEAESKKLMKFCELTWDKKCLKFYKRKDIISKTTSYLQIRKSVYKQSKNKQKLVNEMLDEKLFEKLSEYVKVKVVEESTNELRKKQAA